EIKIELQAVEQSSPVEYRVKEIVEKVLNETIGNIRNLNAEALVKNVDLINDKVFVNSVLDDVINEYLTTRILNDQEDFYPTIDFSVIDTDVEKIKKCFKEYLLNPIEIEAEEIFQNSEKTYDIPPPVRIQVSDYK